MAQRPMPSLGAPLEAVSEAGQKIGVQWPESLASIWQVSNGVELPGGWIFLPVFDTTNPRKTSSDIFYENTKGRWLTMTDDLLVIATGDTGNRLVLRRQQGGTVDPEVMLWDHETARCRKWSKDLGYILEKALARVARIEKALARAMGRRGTESRSTT